MEMPSRDLPPLEERKLDQVLKPTEPSKDFQPQLANVPTIQGDAEARGESLVEGNADGGAPGALANMNAPGLNLASQVNGPLILRNLTPGYTTRLGPGGHGPKGNGLGVSVAEHEAILRALRWLKEHQRNDGGWGFGNDPAVRHGHDDIAVSGLALLCYLAYGKTTADSEFGPTVEKAIGFLKAQQTTEGYFCPIKAETAFQQYPYVHGIATYAICEAYGMTRIPDLQVSMDKAVQIIIAGQQRESGGWDYQYAKGARRDTSVGAWQVQALKAALIAGCTVPGIKDSLDNSLKDLRKSFDSRSSHFGYEKPGDRNSTLALTGAATLCLQFIGHGKTVEAQAGLRVLRDAKLEWAATGEQWPFYAFYYITQCRFHESKASFASWHQRYSPVYLRQQATDGHWPPFGGSNAELAYGPVYTTTLGCLTLETSVRFLPSYQHMDSTAPAATPGDDTIIKIL